MAERKMGCIPPEPGFVSAIPVFGDTVEVLDRQTLEKIAKSNVSIGRVRFDTSYIINQGKYGSCNGCAGAMALTRARVRRGLKRVMLSGTDLYAQINGNRDNGSMLNDGMRSITERGVATLEKVPLTKIYRRHYDARGADRQAKKYKAHECYRCSTKGEVWTALALGYDVVFVVQVGGRFSTLNAKGIPGFNRGRGNHAVAGDGLLWVDGEIVADGYNSWGVRYGEKGRMLLPWRFFEQTIGIHSFYAIRSTTDDDEDVPPPLK